ncbi:hypothetical protein [Neomicrococcus aestuarii]|uniref:Putative esterase n=1 Tax=Neomicrococcus aestuarii TaxID=556325 RepID=A0A1L2ZQ41_9MICC|nr:hypothetical protein [Neomicrococcus aestuarii]APF41112.1 hypothetical protein BHE16_09010 [Neomicrococcus aestuarii]MBB5512964.1 putative esterase [Neomicrococcus aestuarii]
MTVWIDGGTESTTEFRLEELEKARELLNDAHLRTGDAMYWYRRAQDKIIPFAFFSFSILQAQVAIGGVFGHLVKLNFDTLKNVLRLDLAIQTYEDSERQVDEAVDYVRSEQPVLAAFLDATDESPKFTTETYEVGVQNLPSTALAAALLLFRPAGIGLKLLEGGAWVVSEGVGAVGIDDPVGKAISTLEASGIEVPDGADLTLILGEVLAFQFGLVNHQPINVERTEELGYRGVSGEVTDLVEMSRELTNSPLSPDTQGEITIAEMAAPDGSKTYVVTFPGTNTWISEENPFAMTGVAEGLNHGSPQVAKATLESLHAIGAEEGSRVILNGYSQGGVHAANLAGNAEFRAQYNVEQVVTVGSPVGKIEIPEDVKAIHIEHAEDPIPSADGVRNPVSPSRVTAYLSGYVNPDEALSIDPLSAHSVDNYHYQSKQLTFEDSEAITTANAAYAGAAGVATAATVHRVSWKRARGSKWVMPLIGAMELTGKVMLEVKKQEKATARN